MRSEVSRKLDTLTDLFHEIRKLSEKPVPRIYVSVEDHRTLAHYFDCQWQIEPAPYSRRDQLHVNGVPIVWRTGYAGPPTAKDPDPSQEPTR